MVKIIDIQRLGLETILRIFNQFSIFNFKVRFHFNILNIFTYLLSQQVSFFVFGAMLFIGKYGVLILIELIER